jgi:hypothetical protein
MEDLRILLIRLHTTNLLASKAPQVTLGAAIRTHRFWELIQTFTVWPL